LAEAGVGRRVLFLGGNGHCAARLGPARAALQRAGAPFELSDVDYPGFEGRAAPSDFDTFLEGVAGEVARGAGTASLVYATGIGGLLALCLRARGQLLHVPLLLQAPVLWGLERRLMPRLLRLPLAHLAFDGLVAWKPFQVHFAGRCFERPLSTEGRDAFFAGYAHCPVAPDLFRWMGPALLRHLEDAFGRAPQALESVSIWWGGRDRILARRELVWTRQAVDVAWPVRVIPEWGHYPMIDEPDGWVAAVAAFLEGA